MRSLIFYPVAGLDAIRMVDTACGLCTIRIVFVVPTTLSHSNAGRPLILVVGDWDD